MVISPKLEAELVEAGSNLSPKLAEDAQWHKYLRWAVRHMGGMIDTHEKVSLLAYGWEAGSRRERW